MNVLDILLDRLPPDQPVCAAAVGIYWTAVMTGSSPPRCGLAASLRPERHGDGLNAHPPGRLTELTARQMAGWLRSHNPLEASLGMAALNALLEVDDSQCRPENAEDLIREQGQGGKVAFVGHFPFVERLRPHFSRCWVLELNPQPGDLPAEYASGVLPQADVVAITGTAILNHTLDDLWPLCRPDAFIILLGGSAPLHPGLFSLGIDAIGGTRLLDPPAAMQAIRQGATFRQIPNRELVILRKA